MFQLTSEEFEILKSQIVTSSWGGARRALPYAFSEHQFKIIFDAMRQLMTPPISKPSRSVPSKSFEEIALTISMSGH